MSSEKSSEKISVALLIYNEGQTIVETIKKGYQDLSGLGIDFELWIIDNHSSDNTEKDVRALLPTMERLRYQRHPFNLGYSLVALLLHHHRWGRTIHTQRHRASPRATPKRCGRHLLDSTQTPRSVHSQTHVECVQHHQQNRAARRNERFELWFSQSFEPCCEPNSHLQ